MPYAPWRRKNLSYKLNKMALEESIDFLSKDRSSETAWGALYRLLWPFVVGTVFKTLGGPPEGVEDVSQEVFYRLVRFCDFKAFPNADAFLGYLHAICQNAARDFYRKQPPKSEVRDFNHIASVGPDQSELDVHLTFGKMFSELDPDDLALTRHLLNGHTLKEIAQMTNEKYGSLAVRIFRLRAKLRRLK
jgi:RNA polymerase sigma factor (sigma-70 family)